MKSKRSPQIARIIQPQIAEAVAGMELVGAELVNRESILQAIETLNGESLVAKMTEKISKNIGETLARSLTKSIEVSGMKSLAESGKDIQAMASGLIDKSVIASLTKSIEVSGMKSLAESGKDIQAMVENLINRSVADTIKKESQTLDRIIRQLNDSGWLVPVDTRGWWEFAAGSRAGSYESTNSFLPLLAFLANRPKARISVAMESAAFLHQLSEHPPKRSVIAVPKGTSRKGSLGKYRHVNIELPQFATEQIDGIPVHSVMGLLTAMAIRPLSYRDWPNVKKWLPSACSRALEDSVSINAALESEKGLLKLLGGQPNSTYARLAYFFRIADQNGIAEQILNSLTTELEGPIYLGSRNSLKLNARYDSVTQVYDNLIDLK